VIALAFKTLEAKGIVLSKPHLFIQASYENGQLVIDSKPKTHDEAIKEIAKSVPIITNFSVTFFSLTEVPKAEDLKRYGVPNADDIVKNANQLYVADVKHLLEELAKVPNRVTAEARMVYLQKVMNFLNVSRPDLVLQTNLELFDKEMIPRWRELCSREVENVIETYKAKPLASKSIEFDNWYYWDLCQINDDFFNLVKESPMYDDRHSTHFDAHAKKIIEKNPQVDIRSIAKGLYDQKKRVNEQIYLIIEASCENYLRKLSFVSVPDDSNVPAEVNQNVKRNNNLNLPNDIDKLIRSQWTLSCAARKARNDLKIDASKWKLKCVAQGSLICPSSSCNYKHSNGIHHKGCPNPNGVPTILYYWIRDETNYAICNGCNLVTTLTSTCCYTCSSPMGSAAAPIPPNWVGVP
jgi:hypothetical protein